MTRSTTTSPTDPPRVPSPTGAPSGDSGIPDYLKTPPTLAPDDPDGDGLVAESLRRRRQGKE